MDWNNFKAMIKYYRNEQKYVRRYMNEDTHIMLEISIVIPRSDPLTCIHFTPHAVNLKTGRVFALDDYGHGASYNIKDILIQIRTGIK